MFYRSQIQLALAVELCRSRRHFWFFRCKTPVKGSSHPFETIHMAQKAFPKTIFQRNFIIL